MKFVDAHIHLSDSTYEGKVEKIIEDAKQSNIIALVSNSMDLETSCLSLQIAEKYPDLVYAAMGIHPWNVRKLRPHEIEDTVNMILEQKESNGKIVAVGEVGLDFHYVKTDELLNLQKKTFEEMLSAAEKTSLPVIMHSRGTAPQIMSILSSYNLKKVLFHWFSRPMKLLSQIVEYGYFITEGPPTLYSSGIRGIVRRIPLSNLLTETDGPVQFRGPFKGKMTTPSFIPPVVSAIAQIKNKKEDEVADQLIKNFNQFFGTTLVQIAS